MADENQIDVEQLKQDVDKIKSEYNKIKKIIDSVEKYYETFSQLQIKLDDEKTGINGTFNFINSKKEEINRFKEESNSYLQDIQNNLAKVKSNIDNMQASYETFNEIKGKIDGGKQQIEELLASSLGLKKDIENHKAKAQSHIESIEASIQKVQTQIEQMNTLYQDFLQIKSKVEDKDNGLQAILDHISNLKKTSDELHQEIKKFRDNAKGYLSDIEKDLKEANNLKNKIEENHKIINDKKDLIGRHVDLVLDKAFANSFDQRKKQLTEGLEKWHGWKRIFIVLTLVLGGVLMYLFHDLETILKNENVFGLVIARISLATPFLLIVLFAMKQYNKDRDYVERYAFKSATAEAIRNHVQFLIDKFKDEDKENKILECSIKIVNSIYQEPYQIEEISTRKDEEPVKNKKDVDDWTKFKNLTKDLKEIIGQEGIKPLIEHLIK